MNRTEQLVEILKIKPLTRREIDAKLGGKFSRSQIARLLKNGIIEQFEDVNDASNRKWAKIVVIKLRLIGAYEEEARRKGHLSKKTASKYIAILNSNGYTVTPNV